jgi:hypothetical protein
MCFLFKEKGPGTGLAPASDRIADMAKRVAFLALFMSTVVAVHLTFVRPWFLRWGATDRELTSVWPGDELSADADSVSTRAVTIDAPAAAVWPWIAQIGQDRAGWYSYRLLENLVGCRMPRVHRATPAFQDRAVGDSVWMYPADRLGGLGHAVVARVSSGRALVLSTMPMGERTIANGSTIAFLLDPLDASHTRLIMRSRGPSPSSFGWLVFDRGLFQPAHFAMERRMMLTIKALAEGSDPEELPDLVQAALWIAMGLSCAFAAAAVCFAGAWRRPLIALAAGAAALAIATLTQPPVLITALLAAGVAALLGPVPRPGAYGHAA